MTNPVMGTDPAERKSMGRLRWWLLGAGALALAALVVAGALPPRAQATKIDVTTTADELNADGDCSLREAIEAANTDTAVDACTAGSGADVINLPAGNYKLTIGGTDEDANATGDLDILDDLSIIGEDEATTIIDGSASDRVIDVPGFSTVEITGVTLRNGSAEVGGGFAAVGGVAMFIDSTVSGNTATSGGGGIDFGGGTLTLIDSTVSGNEATDGSGGGINFGGGTLTLIESIVIGNESSLFGGGIFNSGDAILTSSIVIGNTGTVGGGGILNEGMLKLTDSTVSGNESVFGGGIENFGGTVKLTNGTVSGNTAALGGGGILNLFDGTLTFTNGTVSGNESIGGDGGGFFNASDGTVDLLNVTVAVNIALIGDGDGIFNELGGITTLKNTIIADNGGENCGGPTPVISLGDNLEDDDTCSFDPLATKADLINTDPLLGPLADYGGPTETHALLPGSPAIDAGHDGASPATDQRGFPRPQGAASDIGAYEFDLGLPGDVDKDGDVDVLDSREIMRNLAGFDSLRYFPDNGDLDGDGDVDIRDALAVLNIAAGR